MKAIALPDLAATAALGARLGRALRAGDFIGLQGDLGAGKTALVRAIAAGAGVDAAEVTSPTFSLINTYRGARFPLHHADLYRLTTRDELYATGFDDLLDGEGAVLVEWLDRVRRAAPSDWLEVRLQISGPESRTLSAEAHGPRAAELLSLLDPPQVG